MIIGCIKEVKDKENRVGITPEGAKTLVSAGHQVIIEESAGYGAGFHDYEYTDAGAKLEKDPILVASQCDILVKVKEPVPSEYYLLEKMAGKTVYTYFHLSGVDPQLTTELLKHNVTAIAYETVEDEKGRLPLLAPMSQIAGIAAIQYGAELLQVKNGGRGRTLGEVDGAKKTNVMIVGGGVVGQWSARTAAGMGSEVKIFEINPSRAEELRMELAEYLGPHLNKNIAVVIPDGSNYDLALQEADLLVGAVLLAGTRAPEVVSEKQVRAMKDGAVIVDVAIDQGGCVWGAQATSHSKPSYTKEGKIYSCVANIPGQFSRQSTQALTAATLPYLVNMANKGVITACLENKGLLKGINTHNGYITYKSVADDLQRQNEFCEIESLLSNNKAPNGIKSEENGVEQMRTEMA